MPKTFKILLEVEEVALGHVMNMLHRTPGVARCDLLLGDASKSAPAKSAPNGAHKPGRKPPFVGEEVAADLLLRLLKKKPMRSTDIAKAFENAGRSGKSISYVLHMVRKDGLIQGGENGYSLTKKGRDRARYV